MRGIVLGQRVAHLSARAQIMSVLYMTGLANRAIGS